VGEKDFFACRIVKFSCHVISTEAVVEGLGPGKLKAHIFCPRTFQRGETPLRFYSWDTGAENGGPKCIRPSKAGSPSRVRVQKEKDTIKMGLHVSGIKPSYLLLGGVSLVKKVGSANMKQVQNPKGHYYHPGKWFNRILLYKEGEASWAGFFVGFERKGKTRSGAPHMMKKTLWRLNALIKRGTPKERPPKGKVVFDAQNFRKGRRNDAAQRVKIWSPNKKKKATSPPQKQKTESAIGSSRKPLQNRRA